MGDVGLFSWVGQAAAAALTLAHLGCILECEEATRVLIVRSFQGREGLTPGRCWKSSWDALAQAEGGFCGAAQEELVQVQLLRWGWVVGCAEAIEMS